MTQRGRRASYRFGVEWIAANDNAVDLDEGSIATYISTLLLADLFGKNPAQVAVAIRRKRVELFKPRKAKS